MKVCRVATVAFFFRNHLLEQIRATVRAGHDVTLVCSDGPEVAELRCLEGVSVYLIEIPREISLWRDATALCRLVMFLRRQRFDVVHSTTPKAGLLAALAGWMARVPVRLHTFTGQPWVERKGLVRFLAKTADRITARMTTRSYADSGSQRSFLVEQGVAPAGRIRTLGSGSIAGVDLQRFTLARWNSMEEATRAELGLDSQERLVTFVGRITRDKGILEVLSAMRDLEERCPRTTLLLIGPSETRGDEEVDRALANVGKNVITLGYRDEPERYLAISRLLCLPSYREGFPIVVIEAAAMEVPTIGSDIIGLGDAVLDGKTGLLVPAKDGSALAAALLRLLEDEAYCRILGRHARERVVSEFDCRVVNALVIGEYEALGPAPRQCAGDMA